MLATLTRPDDAAVLDHVLSLQFAGPHSATGEDMVEWYCHGGKAVIQAVLDALKQLGGDIREAEPGEFTRRAFEAGRIDLNEAEGLADLLEAETEDQRRAALAMAEGHFSRKVEEWRLAILSASARVEALLDFSDEEDVEAEDAQLHSVRLIISETQAQMDTALKLPSAERLRDGVRVVIGGPPNAGKSTLLNALVGREAAITSEIEGTTRDRIEVPVSIGSQAFLLTDTAGLRDESIDQIELIGMERSRSALETADIILWLGAPEDAPREDAVLVRAKADKDENTHSATGSVSVSALTGRGMATLVGILQEQARKFAPLPGEYALHQRQRDGIGCVSLELQYAVSTDDLIIMAEHLRKACREIDMLTGRAGVEEMLDTLFGRFCIGK